MIDGLTTVGTDSPEPTGARGETRPAAGGYSCGGSQPSPIGEVLRAERPAAADPHTRTARTIAAYAALSRAIDGATEQTIHHRLLGEWCERRADMSADMRWCSEAVWRALAVLLRARAAKIDAGEELADAAEYVKETCPECGGAGVTEAEVW